MKRSIFGQTALIVAVIAVAAFGGWRIMKMEPAASKGEHGEEEHGGHGEHHGHGGHGEKEEGHGHEGHGEGEHVELTPEQRKNAQLVIAEAGEAKIKTTLGLYGKIEANEDQLAHVVPRFPGVVKEVRKQLGDKVEAGELLAVVEGNESLRKYEIKAEIPGTIIEKDATRGEFVKDDKTIFTIADLSQVWVNLSVFRQDFHRLKVGQQVLVRSGESPELIEAKVDYISPFGAVTTQTMLARCVIPNADGDLRPGLFVTAEIVTGETNAPVAVKAGAVQTWKEKTVVFVEEGDDFEAREVELGVQDAEWVEIISGLRPGDKYVAANSFILKAQIGKGEAEHEH